MDADDDDLLSSPLGLQSLSQKQISHIYQEGNSFVNFMTVKRKRVVVIFFSSRIVELDLAYARGVVFHR